MMKSLRALLFLSQNIGKHILKENFIHIFEISGKEIRQTSGKEATLLIPIQNVFLLHVCIFFSKTIYKFLLAMSLSWAKVSVYSVGYLLYLRKRSLCFYSIPAFMGLQCGVELSHVLNQQHLLLAGKYNLHPISRNTNIASQGS